MQRLCRNAWSPFQRTRCGTQRILKMMEKIPIQKARMCCRSRSCAFVGQPDVWVPTGLLLPFRRFVFKILVCIVSYHPPYTFAGYRSESSFEDDFHFPSYEFLGSVRFRKGYSIPSLNYSRMIALRASESIQPESFDKMCGVHTLGLRASKGKAC